MKKSSALAMAIAGIVAAPVASAEVYVSARLGVEQISSDDDAIEELTFGNLSSRLGWRGETDLGNGMTAFGSLEVAADGFGLRQLHVGLSGDFGSVKIGESTYAAFYNHVTGPVDQPYWISFPGLIETGRTADVINYEGSAGAVRFGIGIGADGVGDSDPGENATSTTSTQAAVSIDIGDTMTLAIGVDDDDGQEEATTGITLHGTAGDIAYAVSLQSEDDFDGAALGVAGTDDVQGLQIWVSFGQFWVGYGQIDADEADATPTVISAGYSAPIGRQTQWWIEASSEDWDDLREDETNIVAAIRYDYN